MRCARYKTIPPKNRKVSFGIPRQRDLLELVERRLAQADLIREAARLARTNSKIADREASQPANAETAQIADTEASQPADAEGAQIADAEGALPSEQEAPSSEDTHTSAEQTASPIGSITFRWHGTEETVTAPDIWLAVFTDVENGGDAIMRELARRRFRDEPYWKTCDALYLSTSAYYHRLREILHYALACAVSYGLFDPRPPKPPTQKAG